LNKLARATRINPAAGASLSLLREPQYDIRSDQGRFLGRFIPCHHPRGRMIQ
jgi:hypothetical protein